MLKKFVEDIMLLSITDYIIINVVQTYFHQRDLRYGIFRDTQCFYMSLICVLFQLLMFPGLYNKFNLDCILRKYVKGILNLLANLDILELKTYDKNS